jgi:N-acetylmuramoyl-L-alanine amidase
MRWAFATALCGALVIPVATRASAAIPASPGTDGATRLAVVSAVDPASLRPPIVWKAIPFGAKRKRQMAAYSKRHYGVWIWRLTDPHVIVEHFTDGPSFSSAWWTFADNTPDLGELPGVCSHFIVDTDGTTYQLVNLGIRCRHAVGMNWTSIGIEMVATSDRQILQDEPQLRAALRLTVWLMAKFGIQVRNVIGHAETLMSPYHHELYPTWRCLTHSDWQHPDMVIFRRKLRRLATRAGVPIGPPPVWVDPNC